MIGKVKSRVKYSTVENIFEQGLHTYLASVKESLYDIGVLINQNYFAYT
jgi:uncharacterized alpha-E superfamily protein